MFDGWPFSTYMAMGILGAKNVVNTPTPVFGCMNFLLAPSPMVASRNTQLGGGFLVEFVTPSKVVEKILFSRFFVFPPKPTFLRTCTHHTRFLSKIDVFFSVQSTQLVTHELFFPPFRGRSLFWCRIGMNQSEAIIMASQPNSPPFSGTYPPRNFFGVPYDSLMKNPWRGFPSNKSRKSQETWSFLGGPKYEVGVRWKFDNRRPPTSGVSGWWEIPPLVFGAGVWLIFSVEKKHLE